MLKNKKKFILIGAVAALGATMLAGCSQALLDAQTNVEDSMLKAIRTSELVSDEVNNKVEDIVFLGADFDRADNSTYDVDVNGVAKCNDKKNAYVTMSYNINESFFTGISEDDKSEIINALALAIEQSEMKDFSFVEVGNAVKLGDTLKSISESPVKDYKYDKGLVLSIEDVVFDEQEGYVSFQMKNHNKYCKTVTQMVPTYTYINGQMQLSYVVKTNYYYEDFVHTNDIYIRASSEQMEKMKEDSSLIFDTYALYVNNGQKDNYIINSVAVDKVSERDATMLGNMDLDKELE